MISVSYLFEGKVLDHLKKHKGKYALGAAAAGLYYSDDITPRPIKNIIRRAVTGRETIESSDQLLKGYEGHPHYKTYKAIADKLDKEDLNRLTKFGIHNREDMPSPRGGYLNVPSGYEIGGYNKYKPIFQNFRDREIRVRGDVDKDTASRIFKHELGHHIDTEKNAFSKFKEDSPHQYKAQKTEYIARKFAKEHQDGESSRDFIKRARDEADRLTPEQRAEYND
jgi:hypothetical protein